ncbi:MAG TPA: type VI secretion system membrane subunit TssM [Polyangiales bacterium]|nr:type VI secretion system membrane subunit TssM [Polyangiales bacterium]
MLIKLLVAALIFLSLMFLALLWMVSVLAKIPLWIPGSITAFIVITVLVVFLVRALRAQRAARGLEDALAQQAKQQAGQVRPDLQIEVQQMQEEFDKAVSALKRAGSGRRGRDALYFLPWYAIIGPPGAGKSTALRNSGLNFPYSSKGGGAAVKGLGGTRNCDWWLTNEGVVLDTAGRWSTQEEDHDEWISFLALLKRYRPRKPLNGLITAISIGDIANAQEDEIDQLAIRMRERIDEVQTQLRVSIPVYVLFTKCDLLEGFMETFNAVSRADRNQVWGATFTLGKRAANMVDFTAECLDELAGVLETRSLHRMSEERSIPKRTKIYAFPQQFLALKRNIAKFVAMMFQHNIYQQMPALRGVYFTSGTQEGRPFNLLVNRLAEALGSKPKTIEQETVLDQKSYFLHDLFLKIIFEDKDVASASQAELLQQRWRRVAVTAALGSVSLAVGLIPTYAWSLNKLQLTRIQSALDEWEAPAQKKLDPRQKLIRLDPLLEQLNTLVAYEKNGPPFAMRMGMYNQDELVAPLRRYYANLLRRELVQLIVAADLDAMTDYGLRMASVPQAKPSPEEQDAYYELLKLHLLLSQPKADYEPSFDNTLQTWVRERLLGRFNRIAGEDEKLRISAATNAELYTVFMTEFPDLMFTRDKEVVARLRSVLNRLPATQRTLLRLIAMCEAEDYGLNLARMVGATSAIKEAGVVRGAFTRRGWENIVRDRLNAEMLEDAGELWVLGLADNRQKAYAQRLEQVEELRQAYFKAYIEEWRNYLNGLRVERPANHSAALELLRELSRGMPPPVSLLIAKVYDNVNIKAKVSTDLAKAGAEGVVDKLRDKLTGMLGDTATKPLGNKLSALTSNTRRGGVILAEPDVGRSFDGFTQFAVPPNTGAEANANAQLAPRGVVPFDAYQEQLYFVRDALQKFLDNPNETEQLQSRMAEARVKVRSIIDSQTVGFRPWFEALLWPPIERAADTGRREIAEGISGGYCNEIYAEWRRTIGGRYPFNRNGQDLPMTDFGNFYKPKEGRVWIFTGTKLSSAIRLDGDRYVFTRDLGQDQGALYQSRLLDFLQLSQDITRSFYPVGAMTPSIEFEVRVHPSPSVAVTQFAVGGRMVEHYNGPERWKTLSWPGEKPEDGASIVIRGANGMHEVIRQEGIWALYRLIEAGTVTSPGGGRVFTVAWQLQTHDVTLKVDFQPKRGESPFFGVPGRSKDPEFLEPVRNKGADAPKQISNGGRPCN